jgi:hypothetical protein
MPSKVAFCEGIKIDLTHRIHVTGNSGEYSGRSNNNLLEPPVLPTLFQNSGS